MRSIILQQLKKIKRPPIPPGLSLINNQLEEITYFNTYLLPISQKANIQTALNTYGAIRLEAGDYSGVNITIGSNQKIYGHPTLSEVSNITIAGGSTNVYLSDLFSNGNEVRFATGGVTSNCTLKTIKWGNIVTTNGTIQNNQFINLQSTINFNCSASGYFRNNKFIKHQVHGTSNQLVMKANSTTPSFGNVHLHSNFLTPGGDTTDIDGLQSATFVGLDSEAWNFSGTGTKPMLYMQNMGNVKITDFGGGNGYSTVQTSAFNIDADNLFFLNKYIQSEGISPSSIVGAKTNVLLFEGEHDNYVRGAGTVTGFDLKAHYQDGTNYKNIMLDGVSQTSTISNSNVISSILGTQYTPWQRKTWETLPNPNGANWATDRVGKTDSRAYIQNLLDTVGIVNLPEGTYYIGGSLNMIVDGSKGIIGAGTGKTSIVGLTDSFPLISLVESATGDNDFVLANITLQGGNAGVYVPDAFNMIAFTNLKYVIFRNQNIGIHLYRIFGLDNCFFDNVSFVNCNTGFFQDPHPTYTFEDAGYVDKVVFYNGQYLNCGTAVSMKATRADNLNAWINCKFDGNNLAIDMSGNNFPIAANCDFTNHNTDYVISGDMSLYNCKFQNNSPAKAILLAKQSFIEGSEFLDTVKLFPEETHYLGSYYIINSTITGSVVKSYGINQAVYVNSNLLANPTLSKLLVNVKDNVSTVLINTTPTPYPQLLVTQ